MKRRLRIIALLVALSSAAGTTAAMALPSSTSGAGPKTWACVTVDHVHTGACVENPLYPYTKPGGVIGGATRGL